ncbi:MAG: ribonuclease Z [Lentisphaeria bacterium]|nr:ribonuclease Z [Lentisphaeria bacterium]
MIIEFLGTSAACPTHYRNTSAISVKPLDNKQWILVDCGEGTQHQLLKSKLSAFHLDVVFLTHLHGDHWFGLPGLLSSRSLMGATSKLTVVGPKGFTEPLQNFLKVSKCYPEYPLDFVEFDPQMQNLGTFLGIKVQRVSLDHDLFCSAFSFQYEEVPVNFLNDKATSDGIPDGKCKAILKSGEDLELGGKLFLSKDYVERLDRSQRVIICGDNRTPECLIDFISPCDLLIHESTHVSEYLKVDGPGQYHCSAERIATFAAKHNVPNLCLTHFSPKYQSKGQNSMNLIEDESKKFYNGNLIIADDYLRIQIDKNRHLSQI